MEKITSVWVFSLVKNVELHIYLMSHAFLQPQSMVSVDLVPFWFCFFQPDDNLVAFQPLTLQNLVQDIQEAWFRKQTYSIAMLQSLLFTDIKTLYERLLSYRFWSALKLNCPFPTDSLKFPNLLSLSMF